MEWKLLGTLAFMAGSLLAMRAAAQTATWSQLFIIERLETTGGGYWVYPHELIRNSTNDPNNCQTSGTYIQAYKLTAGANQEARELMSRTLLGAFLGGRKVELVVSNACSSGWPVYSVVAMHYAN